VSHVCVCVCVVHEEENSKIKRGRWAEREREREQPSKPFVPFLLYLLWKGNEQVSFLFPADVERERTLIFVFIFYFSLAVWDRAERKEPVNISEGEGKIKRKKNENKEPWWRWETFLHQMNGLLVDDVSSVVKKLNCGWAGPAWLAGWMHLFQRHGNGMSSFHACRPFSQEECVEFFWGPKLFPSSFFRSEEGGVRVL
jgi:hypothetical protein